MGKIVNKWLFLGIICFAIALSCSGQKKEQYTIPLKGKLVYVEALRGEGWVLANPFGELVVLDSNAQTRQVLTWDEYYYAHPNLSPDGKSLIFESKRASNIEIAGLSADSDIYQMDLETKKIINLNKELSGLAGESIGNRVRQPSLSPSGNKLIMVRLADWQFYFSYFDFISKEIIDITGDERYNPENSHPMEWSVDESNVIFTIRRGFNTYVALLNIANKKIISITNQMTESRNRGEVVLCNSGSWINNLRFIYTCTRPELNYTIIFEYDIRVDNSKKVKILDESSFGLVILETKVSTDGRNIVFLGSDQNSGNKDIYKMNLETGDIIQLTNSGNEKKWLRWYEDL